MSKPKNPLYVVKGTTVHPTENVWDYMVERLNLRPLLNILNELLKVVLNSVKDYPTFLMAKNFVDQIVEKVLSLKLRFQS